MDEESDMRATAVVAVGLLLVRAAPVLAQEPPAGDAARWSGVLGLATGQRVELVVGSEQQPIRGRLLAVDSAIITLVSDETPRAFQRDDVRRVRAVKKGRERFRLLGSILLVGGGALSLLSSIDDSRDLAAGRFPDEPGLTRLVLPVAVAGAGGIVLALGTFRPVYER
jgi:hypothetical protein